MHDHLQPGAQAFVDGPYGQFDYKSGARDQVWIAGGIGVTPFISWIRDLEEELPYRIDFYYTTAVPQETLFREEIEKAAAGHPVLRVHISHSSEDGRLTLDKIAATSGEVTGKDIYICGPVAMLEAFRGALLDRGVKAARIHYEEFNFR
jgi:predicted ferric reductase